MKFLHKRSFLLACLINILIIVKGQTNRNSEKHLPIQVIVNPSKASINPAENLIESESKAIELKIESDENNSGKIDLTIAAAKEVKQATETLDRYSPQYNAANDRADKESPENSKSDISSTISKTSRQDPNGLYQSSEFGNIVPFDVMRQIYGHPQPFLFNSDNFSPLQNLRHLEGNLAREVHPRGIGQSLTAVRNTNNEVPLGMVMAHPLYSVGFSTGLDVNPRQQAPHQYGTHPYFETLAMIEPQPITVVQNIPMNRHPLIENSPQRNPEIIPQRLPYRNVAPQSLIVPYQTPHSSENERQQTLHRNPQNNVQSNIPNSVPDTRGLNYAQDRPIYGRHRELQYPSADIRPNYPPPRNIHEVAVSQRPQNDREAIYRSPLPNRQQQIRNEGHDRHLYYTPLSERDPLPQRTLPTYPSREIRRPVDDSHLHRTRIIPQENSRETHQTHSGERQYLPQSRIPTSPPRIQHVPHYTVVPQENLPKYLQNPTYSSAQQSSERSIPRTRHSLPGSADGHPQQPYHSLSDNRYDSAHHNHLPRHSSERDESVPEGYRSLPIGAMSEEIHHASTDSRHQAPPARSSKPAYSSETTNSRELLEPNPSTTRRHKPIGKVHSVPQYQIPPRESQQREDEATSKADDIQQEVVKRRHKYKLNEMEPHKKESKKRRKNLKAEYEDLHAHSSHQYIIKIG
ncbi:hypothetical protein HNY73_020235 [Argiope bruennichi]|uniref:Uncharacterized protein n=1 Tax=Argiope bruennichi TaxID=94029 RepID=A0A8T0E9X1_ARGBR|nr:hypothetical protein HNY73_020235 [Argiope bruennichi]